MKVKLLRDSKILHKAGEIVEVSPAEAYFLISVQSAIEVRAEKEKAVRTKRGAKTDENTDRDSGT
jgi:ribosomal protein L9